MKIISRAVLTFIALGAVTSANAIPLSFDFTGNVLSANPVPNVFGLSNGDTIFGSAFIVDANDVGTQSYNPSTGLTLSFEIGNITFSETQDLFYPDFPTLDILDGAFVNLNFFVFDFFSGVTFQAFSGGWSATNSAALEDLTGTFGVVATPVPEPGMLTLLAAGLLAVGLTRRRRPMLSRAAT